MTNLTPIELERSLLELICDPERPKQLLAQIKAAEAAEAKALDTQKIAFAEREAAAAEVVKQRELQEINTKKSAYLAEKTNELAEEAARVAADNADQKQHLAAWEGRLKEYDGNLKRRAEELDAIGADQVRLERELNQRLAEAQAIIDKAARIAAAAED